MADLAFSYWRNLSLMAVLLALQFLIFTEVFATMTIFGALALAAALARDRRLGPACLACVYAYGLAMLLVSPYLYYLFAFGYP